MAGLWFACFLYIFLQWEVNCQGPPKVTGSYKAVGEMVSNLQDASGQLTQLGFEESYDADTQNAVFRASVMGINVTFVENFKTNQTFRYTNDSVCDLMTINEWIETDAPPSLLHYEDTKGVVRFSLKQLFSIDQNYLKRNEASQIRGIPATRWVYEIVGKDPKIKLTVYEYWSDPSWNTTSPLTTVPLGYIINLFNGTGGKEQIHEENVNIFSFVPDAIDHKLFEPIQGLVCPNRISLVKFPDVDRLQSIRLQSEIVFPVDLEIKYMDVWLDVKNKLYRVLLERIRDEMPPYRGKQELKYQSEIAIAEMQVVFRKVYDNEKKTCEVIYFDDFKMDIQNLFNFQLPGKDWHVGNIFGLNKTTYDYLGKATKRNMPCHVFQGIRKDWPTPESNVTSLWEWCIATNLTKAIKQVLFRNGEYGLVSAEVKILESNDLIFFPPGMKMIHHFYETLPTNPATMDFTSFDIGRCFDETEKRRLQFVVNWEVSHDSLILIENATSDLDFLQKWKRALYQYSGIQPYTLRITEVSSFVAMDKMYVKFTILSPHKDLNETITKTPMLSAFDAENVLRYNILNGSFSIKYTPSKSTGQLTLAAVNHTLELQIKPDIELHTQPPTTPNPNPGTRRTTIDFSLIWPDDDKTTSSDGTSGRTRHISDGTLTPDGKDSSTTTNPVVIVDPTKKLRIVYTGHAPGTVAAVSVAMLLIGITVGSAGVFFKFNGLPDCITQKC